MNLWIAAIMVVVGAGLVLYGAFANAGCVGMEYLWVGFGLLVLSAGLAFLRIVVGAAIVATVGAVAAAIGGALLAAGHC